MEETDLAWLTGLLEGEGSFLKAPPSAPNCPRISLEMTDQDVVERAALLMRGTVAKRTNLKSSRWKPTYRIILKGARAVLLMRILYPGMSVRRRIQIDTALESYIERKTGDNTRRLSESQVRQIRSRQDSSISALAREYEVSRPTIRDIRNRKSWVQVQ
jgi:hypothetical protein